MGNHRYCCWCLVNNHDHEYEWEWECEWEQEQVCHLGLSYSTDCLFCHILANTTHVDCIQTCMKINTCAYLISCTCDIEMRVIASNMTKNKCQLLTYLSIYNKMLCWMMAKCTDLINNLATIEVTTKCHFHAQAFLSNFWHIFFLSLNQINAKVFHASYVLVHFLYSPL